MKQFKKIFAIVLMLCMVMSLCACGGGTEDSEKNSDSNTENSQVAGSQNPSSETESQDDDKIEYTVKVVDESGNPIAGALVQMCSDTCFPMSTDANGVATFNLPEAEYKVSFLNTETPATGYTYVGEETNFYFDGDATELTITLKAVE